MNKTTTPSVEEDLREALDAYDTASAIARMTETREAVQKQAEARTRLFTLALNGTATTEPDTVRGLREALLTRADLIALIRPHMPLTLHVHGADPDKPTHPDGCAMQDMADAILAALSDTPSGSTE